MIVISSASAVTAVFIVIVSIPRKKRKKVERKGEPQKCEQCGKDDDPRPWQKDRETEISDSKPNDEKENQKEITKLITASIQKSPEKSLGSEQDSTGDKKPAPGLSKDDKESKEGNESQISSDVSSETADPMPECISDKDSSEITKHPGEQIEAQPLPATKVDHKNGDNVVKDEVHEDSASDILSSPVPQSDAMQSFDESDEHSDSPTPQSDSQSDNATQVPAHKDDILSSRTSLPRSIHSNSIKIRFPARRVKSANPRGKRIQSARLIKRRRKTKEYDMKRKDQTTSSIWGPRICWFEPEGGYRINNRATEDLEYIPPGGSMTWYRNRTP